MLVIIIILILMILLNFILSKKLNKDREKMSGFECGFDMILKNRLPFSLHFYLIGIIFLIFDIEIALILPFVMFKGVGILNLINIMLVILLILLIGLYMEWFEGALNWFKLVCKN
uniref:NADH dehydrogenase subunit 3 n=1 Tax=Cheiloneurus elegans TaxID=1107371 RepID=UPI00233EB723|nr:NADH dehydrogenase subunit 3 [Cheiloneurus elegans]WBR65744.1 NADH dehydrogenase subunit 3 [Cheiloneurus elegans]